MQNGVNCVRRSSSCTITRRCPSHPRARHQLRPPPHAGSRFRTTTASPGVARSGGPACGDVTDLARGEREQVIAARRVRSIAGGTLHAGAEWTWKGSACSTTRPARRRRRRLQQHQHQQRHPPAGFFFEPMSAALFAAPNGAAEPGFATRGVRSTKELPSAARRVNSCDAQTSQDGAR